MRRYSLCLLFTRMRDTVFSAGGALDNVQTVSLENGSEVVRDENRCQCCIAVFWFLSEKFCQLPMPFEEVGFQVF